MNTQRFEDGARLRFSAEHGGSILEPGHSARFQDRCHALKRERSITFNDAVEILRLEDPEAFRLATLRFRKTDPASSPEPDQKAIDRLDAEAKQLVKSTGVEYHVALERLRASQPELFRSATAHLTLGRR